MNCSDLWQHHFAEELFINLRVWLNRSCQEYGKLSLLCGSEQLSPLPSPDNTVHSLYQHGGMRPASATAAPFWLLQTFLRGDLLQLLLIAFTGREHPCWEISLLLQEDHVPLGQLNLPSTRPEESKVRNVVCGFTWFIKPTKRLVLAKEHRGAIKKQNGTRASSPANCFINLESNNCLLNKALLFCFAIVLFWLPRKAPTLKASQGLYKCCLWF